MKNKIASLVTGGMMGLALLLAGGCCHMHRHHCDKPSCCDKSPIQDKACCCTKGPCCDKPAKSVKPCCNKPPADCPMTEQKK